MQKFITSEYEEFEIQSIELIEQDINMYDIQVQDDHTFCITKSNIISHNCNNMMKAITIPALKSDTSMLVINHVYDNPGAMFTSKIKEQGGGKGLQYMASIILQCSKALEKSEDKDGDGSFYSGTNLRFFTVKNRICRPSLECEVYLDFKKGFTKPFSALWNEAIRGGFILNPKQGYYTVPSWKDPEKCWRQAQLENNIEVWKTFLPAFEKWSQEDLKYSKLAQEAMEAQDQIDREIQNYNSDDTDSELDELQDIKVDN